MTATSAAVEPSGRRAPDLSRGRGQLRALVGLRWRMVRSPYRRTGIALAALLVPLLMVAAVLAGLAAPDEPRVDAMTLAPALMIGYLVVCVAAPLAAGGGNELYPPDQLVALPVRPSTTFHGSLLLAPLNLAWLLQTAGLLGLMSYVVADGAAARAAALVTTLVWVASSTVLGQTAAWAVVGLRRRRAGRVACRLAAGAAAVAVAWAVRSGAWATPLDSEAASWAYDAAVAPVDGEWDQWAVATLVMLVVLVVALRVGPRACGWALHRPSDLSPSGERLQRRRSDPPSVRAALRRTGRASVWRTPALRRGALVLALLPSTAVALAGVRWESLVLLPGLVAAGGGMLFGVNAFCLDGTGATWLATLPARPSDQFWARAQVLAETCGAMVALTLLAGWLRADPAPTVAQLVCVLAAAVVNVVRVTATCMRWSVRRPYAAQLLGPRDTPAPPAAMALCSARLAVSTTLVGMVLTVLAYLGSVPLALVVTAAFLLLSARSLVATARAWDDPVVRARVVATVAAR